VTLPKFIRCEALSNVANNVADLQYDFIIAKYIKSQETTLCV